MDSLTPADRKRRSEVLTVLASRNLERVDTTDGIAFSMRNEPDTVALAGEFIGYESRCCPFVRFALTVEPDGGAVRLAMGGREGVAEFLRATFGTIATSRS
jgi:hypothetical protein